MRHGNCHHHQIPPLAAALFLSLFDLPCRASHSSRMTTPTTPHMLSSKQSCMQSRKHSAG